MLDMFMPEGIQPDVADMRAQAFYVNLVCEGRPIVPSISLGTRQADGPGHLWRRFRFCQLDQSSRRRDRMGDHRQDKWYGPRRALEERRDDRSGRRDE